MLFEIIIIYIYKLFIGSPFECHIVDATKVKIHGNGLERVPVNSLASFIVDMGGGDLGELHCAILGKYIAQYIQQIYLGTFTHDCQFVGIFLNISSFP